MVIRGCVYYPRRLAVQSAIGELCHRSSREAVSVYKNNGHYSDGKHNPKSKDINASPNRSHPVFERYFITSILHISAVIQLIPAIGPADLKSNLP